MANVGNSIPSNVNYAKQKPQAIAAFSRRVKSIATNAQNFGENQYCKIILDTAVPGSNLDPLASYLKFDLVIVNTNPFADYVSFGSAGVANIIDEFRIFCQGTPIEEILSYGIVYELFMDLCGHCREPYYMYRPCKINQKVDEKFHVNAIKPPMVSQSGDPMYYQAVFGGNQNTSSHWEYSSSTTNANKPYLIGTSAGGVSFHKFLVSGGSFGASTNAAKVTDALKTQYNVQAAANYQTGDPVITNSRNTYDTVYSIGDNGLTGPLPTPFDLPAILLGRTAPFTAGAVTPAPYNQYGAFYGSASGAVTEANIINQNTTNVPNSNLTNCVVSGQTAVYTSDTTDGQAGQVYGMPPATSLFGSTCYFFKSSASSGVYSSSDTNPMNPLNWPYIMPNDRNIGKHDQPPFNSIQDYFQSLFNVKNIPIGIKGQARGAGTTYPPSYYVPTTSLTGVGTSINFQNPDQITSFSRTHTITVELPLISGILGSMASKMFPTMLGAPGSTYIELKTAPASKVFQVSMDPCRRVLGTIRDYIPFGGSIGGMYGQFSYLNPTGSASGVTDLKTDSVNPKTYSGLLNSLMSGLVYISTPNGSPTVGWAQKPTYTPTVSNAFYGIGSGNTSVGPGVFDVTDRYILGGCFACIGANLLPFQTYLANASPSACASSLALTFSPYSTAAMEGKWTTYDKVDEKVATTFLNMANSIQLTAGVSTTFGGFTNNGSAIAKSVGMATSMPQSTYASMNTTMVGLLNDDGGVPLASTSNVLNTVNTSIGPAGANQYVPTWCQGVLSGYTINTTGTGAASAASVVYASNSPGTPNQLYEWNAGATEAVQQGGSGPGIANSMSGGYRPTVTWNNQSGRNVVLSMNPQNMVTMNGTTSAAVPQFLATGAGSYTLNNTNWMAPTGISNMMEVTVCGHQSGIPLPQYMLAFTPWAKKSLYTQLQTATFPAPNYYAIWGDSVAPSDLCSETQACFGTYLPASVAQSLRVFNQVGGSTNYVNYNIQNVEFVSQQVILPETVTASVLQLAETGEGINISTNSIRVYQSPLNSSTTQNIIIPAKVASATAIYEVFVPQNHLSTTEGQLYNSSSRLCPFSQIYSSDTFPQTSCTQATSVTSQAVYSSGKYALGQATPFGVVNAPSKSGSFQIQLVLGNEYIPTQPITCISEIVSELSKCNHKLFDITSNMNTDFTITERSGYTTGSAQSATNVADYSDGGLASSGQLYYNALDKRGFCSAFSFPAYLDDQTYIGNPNWNYIGAACWNATMSSYGSSTGQQNTNGATKLLYGNRGPYTLPFFTPLESTFVLGFDLDSWSGYSDVARSGTFLGNNTITLRITDAAALDYTGKTTGLIGINMYSIVTLDLRLSFQAGGTIVPFY